MKKDIYYLYRPIKILKNNLRSGGPVCIKLNENEQAYMAFSNEDLAKYAKNQREIDCVILNSKELGNKEFPELANKIDRILLFDSKDDLDQYFDEPTKFNYSNYLFER